MVLGNSKHDLQILKLYASLERIARKEEMEQGELHEIKSSFASFFRDINKKGNEDIKRYLLDTIKSEHFLRKKQIRSTDLRKIGEEDMSNMKINGDSLLLRAMSIRKGNWLRNDTLDEIIKSLIENVPDLITLEQFHESNESTGVTPIHLAVVQEDPELLHLMAKSIENSLTGVIKNATGENFQGTVMMAGSLLGIAALKCNEKIFSIILEKFDHEMDVTNEKGDNIIHSLIKYACFQPDKLDSVLNMLRYIISCKFLPNESGKQKNKIKNVCGFYVENDSKYRKQVGKLLMMKNREKLTPLQLATKRQQFKIFEIILNHEVCLFFLYF
jgi:ankyrin repeat protein